MDIFPDAEVQKPLGEGLFSAVLPSIPRGVVRGKGLKGVGIHLSSGPPHGSLSNGGVCWAFADEPCSCPPSQMGDEEVREEAVVGDEPVGPRDCSGGDWGSGNSGL